MILLVHLIMPPAANLQILAGESMLQSVRLIILALLHGYIIILLLVWHAHLCVLV